MTKNGAIDLDPQFKSGYMDLEYWKYFSGCVSLAWAIDSNIIHTTIKDQPTQQQVIRILQPNLDVISQVIVQNIQSCIANADSHFRTLPRAVSSSHGPGSCKALLSKKNVLLSVNETQATYHREVFRPGDVLNTVCIDPTYKDGNISTEYPGNIKVE